MVQQFDRLVERAKASALAVAGIFGVLFGAAPALAQSAEPARTSIQTIDSGWQVICRPRVNDRTKLNCSLLYEIAAASDRSRILSVEILRNDKNSSLVIATPLGVSLKDGLELSYPGADKNRLAFQGCQSNGCLVKQDMTPKMVDGIKASKTLAIEFVDAKGTKLRSELNMAGFVPAFAKAE